MPELTVLATALGVGLLLILILWLSIRIVNRGDKLVVYRLGNTDDSLVKGPGLVLLIPFIDRPQRVNLREQAAPRARTVAANLVRPLLLQLAGGIEAEALILSGLLEGEADEVAAAFGRREERRLAEGDWAALLLL